MSTSRRALVRTGVWAAPAVALATAAPAAAHSGSQCELLSAIAWKCPGNAKGKPRRFPKTTIVTLTFKEPVATFLVSNVLFRGVQVPSDKVSTLQDECNANVWYVILQTYDTSEHGSSQVWYSVNGVSASTPVLEDNHPYPNRYPCRTGNC
jgi:hypothetical protein